MNGIEIVRISTVQSELVTPANLSQLNHEYIVLSNNGNKGAKIVDWQISNNTADGWYRELYRFPEKLADDKKWWLDPGELIFVFTGAGKDKFVNKPEQNQPQFHFYMNRLEYLWNQPDSIATLWDIMTNKVSSLPVTFAASKVFTNGNK